MVKLNPVKIFKSFISKKWVQKGKLSNVSFSEAPSTKNLADDSTSTSTPSSYATTFMPPSSYTVVTDSTALSPPLSLSSSTGAKVQVPTRKQSTGEVTGTLRTTTALLTIEGKIQRSPIRKPASSVLQYSDVKFTREMQDEWNRREQLLDQALSQLRTASEVTIRFQSILDTHNGTIAQLKAEITELGGQTTASVPKLATEDAMTSSVDEIEHQFRRYRKDYHSPIGRETPDVASVNSWRLNLKDFVSDKQARQRTSGLGITLNTPAAPRSDTTHEVVFVVSPDAQKAVVLLGCLLATWSMYRSNPACPINNRLGATISIHWLFHQSSPAH